MPVAPRIILSLLGLLCLGGFSVAFPLDPNSTTGGLIPHNITYLGETVIAVPDMEGFRQEESLIRIEKLHEEEFKAWLESNGNFIGQLGGYFQRLMDSFFGDKQGV